MLVMKVLYFLMGSAWGIYLSCFTFWFFKRKAIQTIDARLMRIKEISESLDKLMNAQYNKGIVIPFTPRVKRDVQDT